MQRFVNDPNLIVDDMLSGFVKANPETELSDKNDRVIKFTKASNTNKVGLVTGGGSGHEPAHAGFVGFGKLDAAVSGEVFTSPTPDQVYEAIKAVDSGEGVLLVIKNYTGDVMNFDMAKEMAEMEGIKVESVVVNDDVAVENSTYTA